MATFSQGLKYPWGNGKRLWNILWILIPILGFFAIINYFRKISISIIEGNTSGLPEFGSFWDNLSKGFMLFLKTVPLVVVLMLISWIPVLGTLTYFAFSLFLLPWLLMNLLVKNTVSASFEFKNAASIVFGNFGDYVTTIFKGIGFGLIYIVASIFLVGIPCLYFGQYFFLSDFYARNRKGVKSKNIVKKATTKS